MKTDSIEMDILSVDKIAEDLYAVGYSVLPVFLLDGPTPALFDAGFASLAPHYADGIREVLGTRAPVYLFLTHSHWDHVGGAGYFKSIWPKLRIAGHPKMRDTLARPHALRAIEELSNRGAGDLRYWGASGEFTTPFKAFAIDLALHEGQSVELDSNCRVEVLYTPGHTRDHVSYWIPEKKILVASEAAGCEHGDRIVAEFLVDYDAYRRSLVTLIGLRPEILCVAHRRVYTGPDVADYLQRSLQETDDYVDRVEDYLRRSGGDIEKTVEWIKANQWQHLPYPKQPEPAYLLNTGSRVRHLWERMNRRKGGERRGSEDRNSGKPEE